VTNDQVADDVDGALEGSIAVERTLAAELTHEVAALAEERLAWGGRGRGWGL